MDPQWAAFKAVLANTAKSVSEVKVNASWNEMKKWKPTINDSVSFFMCPQLCLSHVVFQEDGIDEGTQVFYYYVYMSIDH